jgi:hypothetical protein
MNIYSYVARNNPFFAKSLAHKYGHDLKNDPNLSAVLQQLVAIHGEQALADIIEAHPDKELFKEFYNKQEEVKMNASGEQPKSGCGCSCASKQDNKSVEYLNFSGAELIRENKQAVTSTNLMVLAGAIVIAFAILNLKN